MAPVAAFFGLGYVGLRAGGGDGAGLALFLPCGPRQRISRPDLEA
ncbi:hypothetical protein [Pseudotabrizicola sp. L79]